ncbi:MAG: hypothetical protein SOI57_00140 [Leuconostoc gelidum]|jgi:hypothetical protein|uniref:hypothetical protein n=1 Tax=Leuconostoc gelidum TaxID=1244 RepID=UPI002F35B517
MMMVAHKEYERKRSYSFAILPRPANAIKCASLTSHWLWPHCLRQNEITHQSQTGAGRKKVSDWLVYKIYNDALFGPRIKRRVQRLLLDHPEGLTERGHDWYFGYLVCTYTQVYFGIKTLLNYQSVMQEIFQYCFQQEN